jgi:hypothetical protein
LHYCVHPHSVLEPSSTCRFPSQSQLSEATKTIAELQLRSSGKTNLAIFFGEPWLITRSRHRLYGELPADREEGTINHMGTKIIMYGGTSRAEV